MDKQIEENYPKCVENDCLWHSDLEEIFIKDEEAGKCIQVTDYSTAHFTIENKKKKNIALLAIDKCIFNDQSGHKKCDFAFYDTESFVFVEIKDTYKRTGSKKKQAKLQLETTLQHFLTKIDFTGYQLRVIISWKYRPTRPAATTAMQAARLHFLEKYRAILTEGNKFNIE